MSLSNYKTWHEAASIRVIITMSKSNIIDEHKMVIIAALSGISHMHIWH